MDRMKARRPTRRLTTVSILLVLATFGSTSAASGVETSQFFSFERGLQGWTSDHFIDCEHDPTPCTFNWSINHSTRHAKAGTYSLRGFLDGTNDDGTIWMERQFHVEPGAEVTVTLSFWLWSRSQSDLNTWPVVAFIGRRNPETEDDFTIVGQTDQAAGWTRYELTRTVTAGATGKLWVAFGFGATWESERTYFMDAVRVEIDETG